MATSTTTTTTTTLLLSLLLLLLSTTTSSHDLIHSSCVHASYPDICLRTLSSYAPPATTPRALALAAVKISLHGAQSAATFLSALKTNTTAKQKNALTDCMTQISDSVDQLTKTLNELKHLRKGSEFRWQMSNVETWVSAALTNEDTCMDGFKEIDGKVRADVRRNITNVARVTSNALYLINLLDDQSRLRRK